MCVENIPPPFFAVFFYLNTFLTNKNKPEKKTTKNFTEEATKKVIKAFRMRSVYRENIKRLLSKYKKNKTKILKN